MVMITVLFLTPLFHNLPEATLAAILVHAVWRLMQVEEMKRLYRLNRQDFMLAIVALLGVLILDVLPGLIIAVGLSLFMLIYRVSKPHFAVLGKVPGERAYGDIERHPENQLVPGLLILRIDAPVFFANATLLRDEVRRVVGASDPRPKAVLIDLEASPQFDVPSADRIAELVAELQEHNIEVLLARVHEPVLDLFRHTGLASMIGEDHIHHTVDQGVQAFLKIAR
jgi:MFS superfamily sulfate permease-like transporter